MSISIQLPPDLEKQLRASADEAGMDVSQYVLEILEGQLRPAASKLGEKEIKARELLEKINLGISVDLWKRYNYLKDIRDREQLEPEEQLELIRISDKIEIANADRMKHLVTLAKLKEIPLSKLMESLGLQ